jgi:LysM repeat protein
MLNILLVTLGLLTPTDSLRTEVIDGKTFIIHRVESKETLFSISRKYGVALLAVVESNSGADSGLEVGALVKIPYSPNNRTKTKEGTIHRVGQKETLYSIAKQYGVTVDDLKNWNNLTSAGLKLGQELLVKANSASAPNPTPSTAVVTQQQATTNKNTHTVMAGETLYGIARQYNANVNDIKEWNSLAGTDLKPGQVIIVKQTTPVTTTVATPVTVTTQPTTAPQPTSPSVTRTSIPLPTAVESVSGSDETRESGMAILMPSAETGRKYLVNHRSAKPGSIIRIINHVSRQEIFARVIGNLPNSESPDVLLQLSQAAFDKLGGDGKFSVEVVYFK